MSETTYLYNMPNKQEQTKMRNSIKIFDNEKQKPNFSNIEFGSMFRYPKGNGDNVYMKCRMIGREFAAILLTTGEIYQEFDPDKEIEPVTMIQISR